MFKSFSNASSIMFTLSATIKHRTGFMFSNYHYLPGDKHVSYSNMKRWHCILEALVKV